MIAPSSNTRPKESIIESTLALVHVHHHSYPSSPCVPRRGRTSFFYTGAHQRNHFGMLSNSPLLSSEVAIGH